MTGDIEMLREEKLLYERFWTLLGDRDLMRVFERYGPLAFRRSSVLEGFESFLREHNFRGDVVVEIGTLKGLTAFVLSRYFRSVVTIDIIDDRQKHDLACLLGITNVSFVTVRDNAEKAAIVAGLRFDAAYVDGNHAQDTELDFSIVRRCGRVLFHEHWDAQPPVKNLVRELARNKPGALTTSDKWALWTAA